MCMYVVGEIPSKGGGVCVCGKLDGCLADGRTKISLCVLVDYVDWKTMMNCLKAKLS